MNFNFLDERMSKFIQGLVNDKSQRGYRPDIHVLGSDIDQERGRVWLIFSFSPLAGQPEIKDVLGLVSRYFPDFEVDWDSSYGDKVRGIITLALKPFIEKIPLKDANDIPLGFRPEGAGIYSFNESDGSVSYWLFMKEGENFYLVRKDGTKPPKNLTPVEKKEKEGIFVGSLVKTKYGIGIIKAVEDGLYRVKLLGQTKEITVHDVAVFDPEREKEILRQYYLNLYPPEFVEQLLAE